MRVLVLVNFVVAVAAVVVAVMAFGRVDTALDKATGAADKASKIETGLDDRLAATQERARQAVDAAVGSANAKLSTEISTVKADLRALRDDVTALPTAKEVEAIAGKQSSAGLAENVKTLEKKVASLEKQVSGAEAAAGLGRRVKALEEQFATWMEFILPQEVAAQE